MTLVGKLKVSFVVLEILRLDIDYSCNHLEISVGSWLRVVDSYYHLVLFYNCLSRELWLVPSC